MDWVWLASHSEPKECYFTRLGSSRPWNRRSCCCPVGTLVGVADCEWSSMQICFSLQWCHQPIYQRSSETNRYPLHRTAMHVWKCGLWLFPTPCSWTGSGCTSSVTHRGLRSQTYPRIWRGVAPHLIVSINSCVLLSSCVPLFLPLFLLLFWIFCRVSGLPFSHLSPFPSPSSSKQRPKW